MSPSSIFVRSASPLTLPFFFFLSAMPYDAHFALRLSEYTNLTIIVFSLSNVTLQMHEGFGSVVSWMRRLHHYRHEHLRQRRSMRVRAFDTGKRRFGYQVGVLSSHYLEDQDKSGVFLNMYNHVAAKHSPLSLLFFRTE
jgi:hypothetical protein